MIWQERKKNPESQDGNYTAVGTAELMAVVDRSAGTLKHDSGSPHFIKNLSASRGSQNCELGTWQERKNNQGAKMAPRNTKPGHPPTCSAGPQSTRTQGHPGHWAWATVVENGCNQEGVVTTLLCHTLVHLSCQRLGLQGATTQHTHRPREQHHPLPVKTQLQSIMAIGT